MPRSALLALSAPISTLAEAAVTEHHAVPSGFEVAEHHAIPIGFDSAEHHAVTTGFDSAEHHALLFAAPCAVDCAAGCWTSEHQALACVAALSTSEHQAGAPLRQASPKVVRYSACMRSPKAR